MSTYCPKRLIGFALRVAAAVAVGFSTSSVGICFAQNASNEGLPAPKRPGTETAIDKLTPYEAEVPHRVTDISLQQAALDGSPPADLSKNVFTPAIDPNTRRTRGWAATEYAWVPTCIAYHPLYFQQPALERSGETLCPCLQPVISAGQFYGTALALPGLIVLDCPCNCVYAYGYAQSGSACP